jgi:hypothetical protein
MAGYGDGAANKGFDRRSLHQWEGRLLYLAGYPAPPDFRTPGGWWLSTGGALIPPPPMGDALDAAIDEVLKTLSDEQRAEPRFFPDNYPAWNKFLQRWYERELATYDGPPHPPARNNAAGRRCWWSTPGRTLENVLAHIEGGNYPVLRMPPLQVPSLSRRHGSSWMPRQMASRSSGAASSGSASRSASRSSGSASMPRTMVKKESASTAPTRGRSGGALVIHEGARTSSPPAHGRKRKPRKEDAAAAAASDLAAAEAARAEDAALHEAIARSLEDLVPADNAMPMDAPLTWSRQDWEREEAEQRWRLLDLAAARRRAAAAAQPATRAPLIKLEDSSEDDWYRPTLPRLGDAGQGSSRWALDQSSQQAPPPQDSGDKSDDKDDDYTVFYRHLGM